jgi:Na+/proline symporter
LDYLVMAVYLVGIFTAGMVLTRRAGRSIEHFFVGGRRMSWWRSAGSSVSISQSEAHCWATFSARRSFWPPRWLLWRKSAGDFGVSESRIG